MFRSVLVATDGSAHADHAVNTAADIAGKYEASLTIVHVLNHGPVPEALERLVETEHLAGLERPAAADVSARVGLSTHARQSDAHRYKIWQAIGEQAISRAQNVAQKADVKTVKTFIDDGDPVTRILERAREAKADLVVTGSRGLSDLKGLLLGSVSHKIAQLSECTCVTVK